MTLITEYIKWKLEGTWSKVHVREAGKSVTLCGEQVPRRPEDASVPKSASKGRCGECLKVKPAR